MSRSLWLTVVIASALGGALGSALLRLPTAQAQERRHPILRAEQLWVFSADGKHKIQLATYPRGGEAGQPLLGFTDDQGKLKLLFRLHGPKHSPVIVLKDDAGRDRMVIGLQGGGDQAPFVQCLDANGKPTNLHGSR